MSLTPIHQEIQSFVKDPSSLFREKKGSKGSDAKLAELSDEVLNVINDNSDSSFSLSREIGKISRDFLQKMRTFHPSKGLKWMQSQHKFFWLPLEYRQKQTCPC